MSDVRDVYASLRAGLDLDDDGRVAFVGCDPVVASVHRIGDATAAALGLLGAGMATLYEQRGGAPQDVAIDIDGAIAQLMAVFRTSVNGVPGTKLFEEPLLFADSGFYRAGDGRYVYLLLNYPHLRNLACDVLDCPPSHQRFVDAVARWDALALEEAIGSRGGTCFAVRTREEWHAHPQARYLTEQPLIAIERIGDGPAMPLAPFGDARDLPLAGLKVVDNTHVIAGPTAARMLAEHGADVLHLSSPRFPDSLAMHLDTNIGKRCAFCDLDQPDDRRAFEALLDDADVYVCSYLSLDRKGFGPRALAARRPGIVVLDFHGWGLGGPWSQRGGFDQLACAATGFAAAEGAFDGPKLPPTYLLNDYLAAILGAAGVAEALRRRAVDGGSYHFHLDLARICMWVQDLGLLPRDHVAHLSAPDPGAFADEMVDVDGPYGLTRYLPTRIRYSDLRPRMTRGAEPAGASPCRWE